VRLPEVGPLLKFVLDARASRVLQGSARGCPAPWGAALLAQPLSDGHAIHAEVLSEIDLGDAFGVSRDSDTRREIHCIREASACVGQIAGSFFQFVHVYNYTQCVYSSQQFVKALRVTADCPSVVLQTTASP
jgi:hypothetical protein